MPTVYRAVLQDDDGSITRAVEPLFRQWLVDKGLVDEEFRLQPGRSQALGLAASPAWLQHQELPSKRKGEQPLRRLRLVEESEEERWVTTVVWRRPTPTQQALPVAITPSPRQLALTEADTDRPGAWVWIDLEHEPAGGRPISRPGSPRIVRSLMAAGEAHDGLLPLTAEPFVVTAQHVAELVSYIEDSARRVPVIVFAYDAKREYDQADLARRLARDLAGVATVFTLADGATTQLLATALTGEYAVFGGALRTYLPGARQEGDSPSRHRVLGRVSLKAMGARAFPALKDQVLLLSTRRSAPVDAVTLRRVLSPAAPVPVAEPRPSLAPATESMAHWLGQQVLRIRSALGRRTTDVDLTGLENAQNLLAGEIDRLLKQAAATPQPNDDTRLQELEVRLQLAEGERQLLEGLLTEASNELKVAMEDATEVRDEYEYAQLELAEALRANDKLQRRSSWLTDQFRVLEAAPQLHVNDEPDIPEAVAEVVDLARERLVHVRIGQTDQDAAELDVHAAAGLYAAKTWGALLALDAFAAARAAGLFAGDFRSWCLSPPAGAPAISAQMVAMTESETVHSSPELRGKRIFNVPVEVTAEGRQFMPAHIKIVKRGAPAPRLHFYDDCAGASGVVHVGYIGKHLPTARFA